MSKSDFLENAFLNYVFRGTAMPTLTSLHIGLLTTEPSDAGGGTEVSGGSYARVSVARTTGAWAEPSNVSDAQQTANSAEISFPESTAGWGTVTHFGIYDAATAGNLLYWGALSPSRAIDSAGITIRIPVGGLRVSES